MATKRQAEASAPAGFDDLAGEVDGADRCSTKKLKALDTKRRHKAWLMRAFAKHGKTFFWRPKPIYRVAAHKFLSAADNQWMVTT